MAWRLSVITFLGRATPEVKALNLLAEEDIAVLLEYAGAMGFAPPCQTYRDKPPRMDDVSLGDAVPLIVRLGGYLNRKNDASPDHHVMWNGYFWLSAGRGQILERSVRQDDLSVQKDFLFCQKTA